MEKTGQEVSNAISMKKWKEYGMKHQSNVKRGLIRVTKILARYKLLKKFLIYSYEILDLSSPNIRQ